ncbi:hypothetical protein NM688_g7382 [Phlebia brevispora]|uniref:Uncharacterized protein n=1 Tax=Phlebia brevispora TaxID=194682 RepID=A0ACC1S606_9APHY|nr:hypothetical protein NM688_g7382 [Phlebia brevispora]
MTVLQTSNSGSTLCAAARNIVDYGIYSTEDGVALVYLRGRYERQFIVELQYLSKDGEQRESTTARLRGWVMCSYMQDFLPLFGSVSLLSPRRLLLAAAEGIYLYDIPKNSTTSSPCSPDGLIDLRPVWTTYSRWLTRTPIISAPALSDGPNPRARCMLWTGKDIFELDFPLGPVTDDSRYMLHVIHTQYNHAPIYLGYSVGIQHPQSAKKIPTPAFSLAYGFGCEPGHVRLGREGSCIKKARLEKEHVLLDGIDSVGDLSVDEISGRLSVLDGSTGHLQIYDILRMCDMELRNLLVASKGSWFPLREELAVVPLWRHYCIRKFFPVLPSSSPYEGTLTHAIGTITAKTVYRGHLEVLLRRLAWGIGV